MKQLILPFHFQDVRMPRNNPERIEPLRLRHLQRHFPPEPRKRLIDPLAIPPERGRIDDGSGNFLRDHGGSWGAGTPIQQSSKDKARALPWTRWGRRPQTPLALRGGSSTIKLAANASLGTNKIGVWGLRPQRGPGAEPLAF